MSVANLDVMRTFTTDDALRRWLKNLSRDAWLLIEEPFGPFHSRGPLNSLQWSLFRRWKKAHIFRVGSPDSFAIEDMRWFRQRSQVHAAALSEDLTNAALMMHHHGAVWDEITALLLEKLNIPALPGPPRPGHKNERNLT